MDIYLGTVQLFAFNFAPAGWLPCDGRTLPIVQYQALYAILGTTYGGDGRTAFGLPNLTGKEPDSHMKYYIACEGLFPVRS